MILGYAAIGPKASSVFRGSVWRAWKHVIGSPRLFRGTVGWEPDLVRAIARNTEISRDHMTPEIGLHLLTPNCHLYHAPFLNALEEDEARKAVFTEPFWSIYWPGGQALTRFILDEGKSLFSGSAKTKVLDVGCGCGAAAIAAKLVGAGIVVANDIDKEVEMMKVTSRFSRSGDYPEFLSAIKNSLGRAPAGGSFLLRIGEPKIRRGSRTRERGSGRVATKNRGDCIIPIILRWIARLAATIRAPVKVNLKRPREIPSVRPVPVLTRNSIARPWLGLARVNRAAHERVDASERDTNLRA
nr:uncharacterized protein LOC116428350 isoform X1 [Nomia melanderi]XP_031835764.1 uncharacterized protein LOC116428350 isoform X1 [Nomia melanderi]XP_031835767.1 uncharacterized protein LOC116428350 isoform X1 [Nomia melanderi]XP_031835768.1 uncharacterized protein LOC116428350 isoform X1 [Nomia melanderi]XP_031835769.1 uncharacterized protein LOC116428350 isoform X1 [Nomia melanderi]